MGVSGGLEGGGAKSGGVGCLQGRIRGGVQGAGP